MKTTPQYCALRLTTPQPNEFTSLSKHAVNCENQEFTLTLSPPPPPDSPEFVDYMSRLMLAFANDKKPK